MLPSRFHLQGSYDERQCDNRSRCKCTMKGFEIKNPFVFVTSDTEMTTHEEPYDIHDRAGESYQFIVHNATQFTSLLLLKACKVKYISSTTNKRRSNNRACVQWKTYSIRKSQEQTSTSCYLGNVTVSNTITTANTRMKTKRVPFSLTYLKNVCKSLRCICAYNLLVVPSLTDTHVNMNHSRYCMLTCVVLVHFACLCLQFIAFILMQLINRRLLRHKQTTPVTGCGWELDIPGKFSGEASNQSAIQSLYACNEECSSRKLFACKQPAIHDDKIGIFKKNIADRSEKILEDTKKNIIAKLRRKIWLSTNERMHGLPTSVWVSPVTSPVITIITRLAEGSRVHPKESMRHELLRLCTFRSYPTDGKPSCIKLAKAGFYFASQGDEVICYCCAKRISNWNERDDPMRAHRLVSPSCPFLVRNSEVNEPVTDDSNESSNPRISRILLSLEDSDDQTETRQIENCPVSSTAVAFLSSTSRSNTTEPASNPQNGACGYTDEDATGQSTRELPVTACQAAGVSQYTSLLVQRARSCIPAGRFAYGGAAEASVTVKNARLEKAVPVQVAEYTVQGASSRHSDDVRTKLLSENRALKAQSKCLRCLKNDVCIAFLPCGHLVSCEACSTDPSARKCFSCDAVVKARIKAFIA